MLNSWQAYKLTSWQIDKLTGWQDDTRKGWQDDRQDDWIAGWQDDRMAGWQDDRMIGWQDDKWWYNNMTIWKPILVRLYVKFATLFWFWNVRLGCMWLIALLMWHLFSWFCICICHKTNMKPTAETFGCTISPCWYVKWSHCLKYLMDNMKFERVHCCFHF